MNRCGLAATCLPMCLLEGNKIYSNRLFSGMAVLCTSQLGPKL